MLQKFRGPFAAALAAAVLVSSIGVGSADARSRRHYNRGDAAVAGAALGFIGTIAAIAAQDQYRDRYQYYDGPAYRSYGYAPYRHNYRYDPSQNWETNPSMNR